MRRSTLAESWIDFEVDPLEMRADYTLAMGQCFNWMKLTPQGLWIGVIKKYPLAIKQNSSHTSYSPLLSVDNPNQLQEELHHHFQLNERMSDLYDLVIISFFIFYCSRII
jgi:hypothetical protein